MTIRFRTDRKGTSTAAAGTQDFEGPLALMGGSGPAPVIGETGDAVPGAGSPVAGAQTAWLAPGAPGGGSPMLAGGPAGTGADRMATADDEAARAAADGPSGGGERNSGGGETAGTTIHFDAPDLRAAPRPSPFAVQQNAVAPLSVDDPASAASPVPQATTMAADSMSGPAPEMTGLVVTTLADVVDGGDSVVSLREAVAFANAQGGADTITFDASLAGGLIRLTLGQIAITDAVTIDGAGMAITITGDANGNDALVAGTDITDVAASGPGLLADNSRIFDIGTGAATAISGLTLTGGRTTANVQHGGAIRSYSALTLDGVTVSGNSTAGNFSWGGGIMGVTVTLTDSTVSGNATTGSIASGGGIYGPTVTLTGSTVSGNSTAGVGAYGGGVYGRTTSLTNSTVSGNSTAGDSSAGGGIWGIDVSLTNGTVSGNATAGDFSLGGGIVVAGALALTDSIVSGNVTAYTGVLGDEVQVNSGGTLTLTGGNILGTDVFSGATDVGDTTSAAVFAATAEIGTTGVFGGVLAQNGGPVATVALRLDVANPALDASAGPSIPATDARGVLAGNIPGVGVETGSGIRDLGAFELAETPSLVVTTLADVVDTLDGLTSLREAVAFANAKAGADTVSFDASLANGLIRLTGGQIVITGAVTIDGAGMGITITGDALGDDVLVAGTDITNVGASGAGLLDDNSRIFVVGGGAATTISGLTLTGGRTTGFLESGGAIRSSSALTLDGVTISGNSTAGMNGAGGGVSGSTLTLIDSTVSGNATAGTQARGGGLYGSTLTLTNSTVNGNSTTGHFASGGGIYVVDTVSMTNTTVAGNSTVGVNAYGGGIGGVTVSLANSTVTGNATWGSDSTGGGIRASSAALSDSIVSGNVTAAAYVAGDEVEGGTVRHGFNIIHGQVYSGSSIVGFAHPFAVFAQVAEIGTTGVFGGVLANNGGPVATVALRADVSNPALDRSAGPWIPATDARGVAAGNVPGVRAETGPGIRDLGAFEALPETPSLLVTTLADVVDPFDGLISLREAVAFANAQTGADTVSFAASLANGVIRLTGGEINITGAVTIDGAGLGIIVTGDANGNDALVAGTNITDVAASGAAALADNSRIFDIGTGAATTITGLTLTGGRTTAMNQYGGAIRSSSTLTLDGATVAGNSTAGDYAHGGGVFGNGVVTLTGSTVSGNATAGYRALGGGVFGNGAVSLTNSTVGGNSTAGFQAHGGGVLGISAVILISSTVTGNATAGSGAGGGGIGTFSALTLTDSIVSGNVTSFVGLGYDEVFSLTETLAGGNILGTNVFSGATDVGDTTTAAIFDRVAQIGTTGVFGGVLGDNGGPVATIALKASLTNPALDVSGGSSTGTDARGLPATDITGVGAASGAGIRDLGAFETQTVPTQGPDILFGTAGADSQAGDAGDDLLIGSPGADLLYGGAGTDTVDYSASVTAVTVILSSSSGTGGHAEGDRFFSIENLTGSNFNDVLLGDGVSNTIDGGAGSDVLSGEGGSDALYGGLGFDALSGADGGAGVADTLFGGADLDIAYYFTANSSQVVDFNDRTNPASNSGEHTLDTWDSIEGFYGANDFSNTITGDGQDNLFLGGNQADVLYGGGGSDILTARAGADLIYGGLGNDFLSGDAGDDTIYGGEGDDTFYIFATSGIDRISDYSEAQDSLLFFQTGATQWSDLTFTTSGNDVHITRTGSSFTVIVEGATLADLDNSGGNFAFL